MPGSERSYTTKYDQRVHNTERQLRSFFEKSLKTMLAKNSQRGDCWRPNGLLGQFCEIHSVYFRLRNLIWEQPMPSSIDPGYAEWSDAVANALEDLRNFTILGEMCLSEKNLKGELYPVEKKLERSTRTWLGIEDY